MAAEAMEKAKPEINGLVPVLRVLEGKEEEVCALLHWESAMGRGAEEKSAEFFFFTLPPFFYI